MPGIVSEDLLPEIGYFIYRKCTPHWHMEESVIDFCDITYVVEGKAHYTVNGSPYFLQQGDLLCLSPGAKRKATTVPENPMTCYSFNFQLYCLNGSPASLPFPIFSNIGYRSNIVSLYKDLAHVWMRKDPGFKIRTRGLVLLLFHRFFELTVYNTDTDMYDPRVKRAMRYITDNFYAKIPLASLAAQTGLNPVYFGALFKRETGMTVNQYITRVRVAQAENLLRSGEYTVADVAEHCGFCDVFYFRKVFRAVMGVPPSRLMPHAGKTGNRVSPL